MVPFKVTVVTGTRAEYGLLRPVLRRLAEHGDFETRLVVTGAHLSAAYGHTIDEIVTDGFTIDAKLDILAQPVPEGRAGTARRTALALALFCSYFEQPASRPDVLLLLGDRYEIFAAGQAAALQDIPLAHISGGDVTLGADDDWFRHCLTKMAKLHFPSCEVYRQRIIHMGEEPGRVFNVGGLGDENIRSLQLFSRDTLAASLGLDLSGAYALITFHPETASPLGPDVQADALLAALAHHPNLFCLFTAANADAGGQEINARVKAFCKKRSNVAMVASLGVLRYLSAMKHAAVVVGNSSSGVVETPSLGAPTVDIGDRQKGRVTGDNVLHCELDENAIAKAISSALDERFAATARAAKSPYNGGATSTKIVDTLASFLQGGQLAGPKAFYDAPCAPVK